MTRPDQKIEITSTEIITLRDGGAGATLGDYVNERLKRGETITLKPMSPDGIGAEATYST
jgi:hypothetical protein